MKRLSRPLPLAIAAMLLLICVKLTGLVQATGLTSPARANAAAHAPAAAAPSPSGHGTTGTPPPVPTALPTALATPAPAAASPQPAADPPVGDAERLVLQELRARRNQLEVRVQAMETREAVLAAAERRLGERVAQLSALQARLEQLESGRRERDEANWRSLVKTYETMRPRDAAAILNDMDGPVLLQVLDRMKEAKTAAVLAAMLPERARAATAQLAQWRSRSSAAPDLAAPAPATTKGPQG